jgi:hypothetical protein
MSARLPNETFPEYRAREKAEQATEKAARAGKALVSTGLLNRSIMRGIENDIPNNHLIVLSKAAELAGNSIPVVALLMLYHKEGDLGKEEMINALRKEINEFDSLKIEPNTLKGENNGN